MNDHVKDSIKEPMLRMLLSFEYNLRCQFDFLTQLHTSQQALSFSHSSDTWQFILFMATLFLPRKPSYRGRHLRTQTPIQSAKKESKEGYYHISTHISPLSDYNANMTAATAPANPKLMTISFAPANLPEAALVVCWTTPPEVVPVAPPEVVELVDAWPGERF